MSLKSNAKNVDVKYYYNKKSKYFEELKDESSSGKISVHQFFKYLTAAYCSDNLSVGEFDFYFTNSTDWLRVTKIELFCELIDIDEVSIYSVMNERDDLNNIRINKDHEIFSYCDYLFDMPPETNVPEHSDSSEESFVSLIEEIIDDNQVNFQETLPHTLPKKVSYNSTKEKSCKGHPPTKEQHKPMNNSNSCSKRKLNQSVLGSDVLKEKPVTLFKDEGPVPNSTDSCDLPVKRNKYVVGNCYKTLLEDENKIFYKKPTKVIHVIDDVKKISKDFHCSEELIVSKIGLLSNSKVIDSPITLHCDLIAFNWVMDWLLQNSVLNKDLASSSTVNSKNVISFLICVSQLQIKELTDVCLCYCKNNINEVLKSNKDFESLDSSLFNRFTDMFSNIEVEALNDKKNRIRSFLYCKLILSLCLPEPEPWKGHFSTLADVFRCVHCKKLVMYKIAKKTPCLPNNIQMNIKGEMCNVHAKQANWTLTSYIAGLRKEMKCWRKVYWHLWAECHFLYCTYCKTFYSVYYYNTCHYHPEEPRFSIREKYMYGRYLCCGSRAYMYECIAPQERGCKLKQHSPELKNNRAATDVMKLLTRFHRLIFTVENETNDLFCKSVSGRKVQLNLVSNNKSNNSFIIYTGVGKETQWRLPYFTPYHLHKRGLVIQGFAETNQKGETNVCPNWTVRANQLFNVNLKSSSSLELCKKMTGSTHKNTLVGLLLQAENSKPKNYDSSSESSNSNDDSDDLSGCSNVQGHLSVNKQALYKENMMKRLKYAVRINQDIQRESEDHTFIIINSFLSSRKHKQRSYTGRDNIPTDNTHWKMVSVKSDSSLSSYSESDGSDSSKSSTTNSSSVNTNIRISHSRKTAVWNSYTPLAGSFMRIESEWRNTKRHVSKIMKNRSFASLHSHNQPGLSFRYREQCDKTIINSGLIKNKDRKICFFDDRTQELGYLSAAYKPIALRKEYRFERYRLNIDWNNVIAVEQVWNAFLQLFFENEKFPMKDYKKNNTKPDVIELKHLLH